MVIVEVVLSYVNKLVTWVPALLVPGLQRCQRGRVETADPSDVSDTAQSHPRRARQQKAIAEKHVDQQVRSIDLGKSNVAIGIVYRGKLNKPRPDSVAEHDHVSEVYHIISGSATLVLGPDIVNRQRRPATLRTVIEFNGPGNNGSDIKDGVAHNVTAGDVVVIPAGTGHWFTKIDDHINYLMIRIDPDKVAPLKDEAKSKDYLSKPARDTAPK